MHFWIDKRSQRCGFNRRQVPLSFSGYGRDQRNLCGSFYPKPMVTPVHRFQSIESVANNGLRYSRGPNCHARPIQYPPSVHFNGSSSNIRMPQAGRSLEMVSSEHSHSSRQNIASPNLKCVWIFFALVAFFVAGAKYYFHGLNIGVEALVFCSLLILVLVIGGMISLCEGVVSYYSTRGHLNNAITETQEQQNIENPHQPVTSSLSQSSAEVPPPPYHIAIMLSSQNNLDALQVMQDSPPPSYEKVVT